MKHRILINAAACVVSTFAIAAWAQIPVSEGPKMPPPAASAVIIDGNKNAIGSLSVYEGGHGLLLRAVASDLAPGWHGFHFHQKGTCEDAGFKASGDHFMPHAAEHGVLAGGPHAGDLPNIFVAADGTAHVDVISHGLKLHGDTGLLDSDGAAIVIHAGPDDYQSQPSGAAGERVACGVLKPEPHVHAEPGEKTQSKE